MKINNIDCVLMIILSIIIVFLVYRFGTMIGYKDGQIDYSKGIIKWKLENQPPQWMFYKDGVKK